MKSHIRHSQKSNFVASANYQVTFILEQVFMSCPPVLTQVRSRIYSTWLIALVSLMTCWCKPAEIMHTAIKRRLKFALS